jgi:hypothetical protein
MGDLFNSNPQPTLGFPQSLTETYKPLTLGAAEWCGLEKQRKILSNLAANPRPGIAVLLEGAPGVGENESRVCLRSHAEC